MNRYPAFHGNYYRSAYNYRHYFDYPWHAGLHEPTSHLSYTVPRETTGETIPSPEPIPAAEPASTRPRLIRAAHVIQPLGESAPVQARTLRR